MHMTLRSHLRRACTREKHTPFQEVTRHQRFPHFTTFSGSGSGTVFFMIVSLPADAADTICCSMDLVTLALSALRMWASLMRAGFLGGSCRRPFFGADAALAACLAFEDAGLACRPLVLPCAMLGDRSQIG
jgi:hypothetical protein